MRINNLLSQNHVQTRSFYRSFLEMLGYLLEFLQLCVFVGKLGFRLLFLQ